ncbi:MAG: uncharacterized protein A8A55_1561 [Amphiamblys sp. WSBS2006]|nr:MAG: uncharacterized protein A8A55_1561 [Amphiamblys sp. WSBS2006]
MFRAAKEMFQSREKEAVTESGGARKGRRFRMFLNAVVFVLCQAEFFVYSGIFILFLVWNIVDSTLSGEGLFVPVLVYGGVCSFFSGCGVFLYSVEGSLSLKLVQARNILFCVMDVCAAIYSRWIFLGLWRYAKVAEKGWLFVYGEVEEEDSSVLLEDFISGVRAVFLSCVGFLCAANLGLFSIFWYRQKKSRKRSRKRGFYSGGANI